MVKVTRCRLIARVLFPSLIGQEVWKASRKMSRILRCISSLFHWLRSLETQLKDSKTNLNKRLFIAKRVECLRVVVVYFFPQEKA